ncbi:MAG: hypothetical protein SNG27_09205 [Rikenellaceae bacterium]
MLLVAGALFSCDKTNSDIDNPDEPSSFELSIDSDEIITDSDSGKEYSYIKTTDYDYEFNIISGNGDYKVVESNDCRVTIEDDEVVVNMYREHSNLTLEDSEGLQKLVWIQSSNEMFNIVYESWGLHLSLPEGNTSEHTFDFGIGDYTIECIKGNSATAEFISDNSVKFSPIRRGTTHFEVKDGRGLSVPYNVMVSDNIDMREYFSNVEVVAEDFLYILIDKNRNWAISSVKSESIFEMVTLYKGDDSKDYDYLQVNIADDVEKDETGWIKLMSEGGLEVEILFYVK